MILASDFSLLIGTRNQGKVKEIAEALSRLPIKLQRLDNYADVSEPVESGESYAENALIKGRYYARQTGLWTLADDSGLEVQALGGAPGVTSARFGGQQKTYSKRIELLLSRLAKSSSQTRRARFVCVTVITNPEGDEIHRATGTCDGRIAIAPSGHGGFGFDPIFIPHGHERTFAELPLKIKNTISHRAKALAATREFLSRFLSHDAVNQSKSTSV